MKHDEAVDRVAKRFEDEGCKCSRNAVLGSRRPDLKCCDAYIEVKATPEDLNSTRTKHQLQDIKHQATKLGKPTVLYNGLDGSFTPLNDEGKSFLAKQRSHHSSRKTKSRDDETIGLGTLAVGAVLLDLAFNQGRGTQQAIDVVDVLIAKATNFVNNLFQPNYRY